MQKLILHIAFFLVPIFLMGQISPGDLSVAHEKLEGISNCTQCHVLGQKVTNEKCTDCHKEIKNLVSQSKGYHASNEALGKECVKCHSEHHGRKFELIRFNEKEFNHNLTGFNLEGKHKTIECRSCHKPNLIQEQISKKKEGTYLGLGDQCIDCHQDPHKGTLSKRCYDCHGTESFEPAPNFRHEKTNFPLKGKHAAVSCDKCHKIETVNNQKYQHFSGIGFDNCTSCHKDVHNNKFGQNCKQCHNENSFLQLNNSSNFDHSKTSFPLLNKHAGVKCKSCHTGSYSASIPHNNCFDCHEDYHKGQLNSDDLKRDCSDCHSTKGFSPSNYTINQHNETRFKLSGAHMATPCFQCHQRDSRWEFSQSGNTCTECHQNIHENYISDKYIPENRCESCHNTNTWNDIEFDHDQTDFALSGKHSEISCGDCHFKSIDTGSKIQKFKDLSTECETCHNDIHRGQFIDNNITKCERCHGFKDWKPDYFDHDKTTFKLEGVHEKTDCFKCHPSGEDSKGKYTEYKFQKEMKCADCHS